MFYHCILFYQEIHVQNACPQACPCDSVHTVSFIHKISLRIYIYACICTLYSYVYSKSYVEPLYTVTATSLLRRQQDHSKETAAHLSFLLLEAASEVHIGEIHCLRRLSTKSLYLCLSISMILCIFICLYSSTCISRYIYTWISKYLHTPTHIYVSTYLPIAVHPPVYM